MKRRYVSTFKITVRESPVTPNFLFINVRTVFKTRGLPKKEFKGLSYLGYNLEVFSQTRWANM